MRQFTRREHLFMGVLVGVLLAVAAHWFGVFLATIV